MKKLLVLVCAVMFVVVFTMPAAALENQFGGYWRTRFFSNQNLDGNGEDLVVVTPATATTPETRTRTSLSDVTAVDTRTRLFWTAVLNDDLKFVNRFEFNGVWGDYGAAHQDTWTDFGADGTQSLRIKNSYVEFNAFQIISATVGVWHPVLGRGFIFDDDAPGAAVFIKAGDMVTIPLVWLKAYEGSSGFNKCDVDAYAISPVIKLGPIGSINPYFAWVQSENGSKWTPTANFPASPGLKETNVYYGGINGDFNVGPASIWATFIYEFGSADLNYTDTITFSDGTKKEYTSIDFSAMLAALGFKVNVDVFDIHGQGIYATGDDDNNKTVYEPNKGMVPNRNYNPDRSDFVVPTAYYRGQYYAWAELLGDGIFDYVGGQTVPNSPGTKIGNCIIGNLGVGIKPLPVLGINFDVWYAKLAEDVYMREIIKNADGTRGYKTDSNGNVVWTAESDLGIELDLRITYQLVKGLNLDIVGAYLFAGEAIYKGADDENPWEVGSQLSLAF